MAQMNYPAQYQRALGIRASKRQKIDNALPVVTDMAVQAKIRKSIRRDKRINADQRATYNGDNADAISNTGTVYRLTGDLGLGDASVDQFSGESITPTEVNVNWSYDASAGLGTTANQLARIMIFQWKGTSANASAAAYITDTNTVYAPLGNLNWDNFRNYTCLADSGPISFVEGTTGKPNLNGSIMTGTLKVYGRRLRKIYFNSSGNIEKNDLLIVAVSNVPGANIAVAPTLSYRAMVRYLDEA